MPKGWCCFEKTCCDKNYLCSECYSKIYIRRNLDAKTTQHHYFRKSVIEGENFPNTKAVLKEGEWHEIKIV
jgi:hypothetical protein